MLMNMKDLLAVASEHNFAIPAFNVSHYTMFKHIMEALTVHIFHLKKISQDVKKYVQLLTQLTYQLKVNLEQSVH